MHRDERLPIVAIGTRMDRAIEEISSKGFGCVIVVETDGTLAGIVTDGDLRRHLRPDLRTLLVDEVMTRSPRIIVPDALVATALEVQETSKITALIVVENGRPVGLVHYLDLLRVGVA
jgi:arabinose-5-phosphate isomerase